MASAQDLRKRIKSVTNTQQITKAMKMVASARLRRAQSKARGTAPYADSLGDILRETVSAAKSLSHPLMTVRPVKRTAYLVIGADKGLAGAYTGNLMKAFMAEVQTRQSDSYEVISVGRKPADFLKHRRIKTIHAYSGFSDKPAYEHAEELVSRAAGLFLDGTVDEVVMFYTHFVNSLTQEVRTVKLLPLEVGAEVSADSFVDFVEDDDAGEVPDESFDSEESTDVIFVPDAKSVYYELLPKYLGITVYNGLLQSAASELGARMTAMTAATDNAGELISALDLEYNKLRQAGITNEISEIVGGANALQ